MRKLFRSLCVIAYLTGTLLLAKEGNNKAAKKQPTVRTVNGEMLVKWNDIYFYDIETKPFTGIAISKTANGKKSYEAHLQEGKPHGTVTIYNKNGDKQSEGHYKNGIQHGIEINWHPNGAKQFQVNHQNGKRHGKMTSWKANGLKEMEVFFVDGLMDGPFNLYDENGQQLSSKIYKKGKIVSGLKDKSPAKSTIPPKDILAGNKFAIGSHNNPDFPQWIEKEKLMVLTPSKKKQSSGWLWMKDEFTPPFELSMEYLAKDRSMRGRTTNHSGMSILFCTTSKAKGKPETNKNPGFIKDSSGYALLISTSGKQKGFQLLDAKGKVLDNSSNENTHSGGKWKKIGLRVQHEGIHVYFENQSVFSITNPDLKDMEGGLAIVAANSKTPCMHSIRNLVIRSWNDPVIPTPPKPKLLSKKNQVYTIGYAHLENKDGVRYETGTNKPFSGKAIDFYKNGEKKLEYYFKDGLQDGASSFWYPNGQMAVQIKYIEGVSVEENKWTEKGEIIQ
jgi:antitoxin component YwqK of YwqJK toxin-antitoxin module